MNILTRRNPNGQFQGKCRWCDWVSPEYPLLRQVENSVRKHMKNDHLTREGDGQREPDVAATE